MPNGFVSSHGVIFATFRRALYAVFKGTDNSDLWWTRFDGTTWQPLQRTGGMCSPLGPTLTVYRGALYLACKSDLPSWRDLPDAIWWIPFDGQVWKERPRSDNLTNETPALGVWGEGSDQKLVMVHKGNEADESLYYSTLDGYTWTPKQPIGGRTDAPPSLTYYCSHLYACWKEAGDDEHIMYSAFDGNSWTDPKRLPGEFEIGSGPSLAVFNEQLYILWRGWDNKLWWASAAPSGSSMTKTTNPSEPPTALTATNDHPVTSEANSSQEISDATQTVTDAAPPMLELPQAVITPQLVPQPVIQQPAVPQSAPSVQASTSVPEPVVHSASEDGITATTTGVPAVGRAAPRPPSSSSSSSDDLRRLKRGIKKGLKKGVSEISDKFHGRFRRSAPK
jgi:hypothetical protein